MLTTCYVLIYSCICNKTFLIKSNNCILSEDFKLVMITNASDTMWQFIPQLGLTVYKALSSYVFDLSFPVTSRHFSAGKRDRDGWYGFIKSYIVMPFLGYI